MTNEKKRLRRQVLVIEQRSERIAEQDKDPWLGQFQLVGQCRSVVTAAL